MSTAQSPGRSTALIVNIWSARACLQGVWHSVAMLKGTMTVSSANRNKDYTDLLSCGHPGRTIQVKCQLGHQPNPNSGATFCCIRRVWLWASYLSSLILSFFLCKFGAIRIMKGQVLGAVAKPLTAMLRQVHPSPQNSSFLQGSRWCLLVGPFYIRLASSRISGEHIGRSETVCVCVLFKLVKCHLKIFKVINIQ